MVRQQFRAIVRRVENRKFNYDNLIKNLQAIRVDGQPTLFASLPPANVAKLEDFCNAWVGFSNNETIIWFIEAALQTSELSLAFDVATTTVGILNFLPDSDPDKKHFVEQCIPKHLSRPCLLEPECPLRAYLIPQESNQAKQIDPSRATTLETKTIPRYTNKHVHERTNEMAAIIKLIQKMSAKPDEGYVAVHGEDGCGKSTLLSQIFVHEKTRQKVLAECNIHVALWIECYRWKAVKFEDEVRQRAVDKVIETEFSEEFMRVVGQECDVNELFDTVETMVPKFTAEGRRVLFILEDVINFILLKFMRQKCPDAMCLITTRDISALLATDFLRLEGVYKIPTFAPVANIFKVLSVTFHLRGDDKLSQQQVDKLVERGGELPLVANMLTCRFSRCKNKFQHEDQFQLLVKLPTISPSGHDRFKTTVSQLLDHSLNKLLNQTDRARYYSLQLFEPNERINVVDLLILWFPNSEEERNVIERATNVTCTEFVNMALARPADNVAEDAPDLIVNVTVHHLLHEAADMLGRRDNYEVAKLEQTVPGFDLAALIRLSQGVKNYDSCTLSVVTILLECIRWHRRGLILKILDKLDPRVLADICKRNDHPKTSGLSFLHHLYNAQWMDAGVEESLKLVYHICQRLRAGRVEIIDVFRISQLGDNLNSLLSQIIREQNESEAKFERGRILSLIWRWYYVYEETCWKEDALQRFKDDELYMSVLRKCEVDLAKLLTPSDESPLPSEPILSHLLHYAARLGALGCVRVLYGRLNSKQSLLMVKDKHGHTPLSWAVANGHIETVRYLVDLNPSAIEVPVFVKYFGTAMLPLSLAAANGHVAICKLLYERFNVAIEKTDEVHGRKPLSWAVWSGHFDTVEFIYLNHGDAVSAQDSQSGRTPFFLAARHGHLEVAKFLYEKFSDAIKMPDTKYGQLPLHVASWCGHIELVKFLYENYPDAIEALDNFGETPLLPASRSGHLETVKFLYSKYPIAVQIPDAKYGRTPLICATEGNVLDVVRFVYAKHPGAVKIPDKWDRTPLTIALQKGNEFIISFLKERTPQK